jgi:alkyl hydroperoxide reductase subunit AhpC
MSEREGHSRRGPFIKDAEGVLRATVVHDNSVARKTDEALRVLSALQKGELRATDWQPGTPTPGSEGQGAEVEGWMGRPAAALSPVTLLVARQSVLLGVT